MKKHFNIMIPYRINKYSNKEYTEIIRELVEYMRDIGIQVYDLKESDILDQNRIPVEHVYLISCFGETDDVSHIFGNSTTGYFGETILFA